MGMELFMDIHSLNKNFMFSIQIGDPVTTEFCDPNDKNIEEAIETIFPLDNEFAFIIWNYIFIPITYKYDVSVMINDVLYILNEVRSKHAGRLEVHWASNTFSSVWNIKFGASKVEIKSVWYDTLGRLKNLLNEYSFIEVEKISFIEEWSKMLKFLLEKLKKSGYTVDMLADMDNLEGEVER